MDVAQIIDTDEIKILNQYIHDLEEKIKIMDYNYTKLNRKLIQVQNNYENMDILHDKIYSILTSEQKDRFVKL